MTTNCSCAAWSSSNMLETIASTTANPTAPDSGNEAVSAYPLGLSAEALFEMDNDTAT